MEAEEIANRRREKILARSP